MSVVDSVGVETTRISLRDLSEATFRALMAHGASNGEARVAARMVLQAQFTGADGVGALLADLAGPAWSRSAVSLSCEAGAVSLGSPGENRVLREVPLAVELVASGDESMVRVACDVLEPALVDAVLLEAARVSGAPIAAVVSCSSDGGGHELRVARPNGSLGAATLANLPSSLKSWSGAPGVVAMRDVDALGDVALDWKTAEDRAGTRADAAELGLSVEAPAWRNTYTAAREYLVRDRYSYSTSLIKCTT